MEYANLVRIPQYFRNLQRLGEIVAVLIKHGFGDLIERIGVQSYLQRKLQAKATERIRGAKTSIGLPTRLRLVCEELGPTFVKLGQLAAARSDIFPEGLIAELRLLQDQATPFSSKEAKLAIEKELGKSQFDVFKEFIPIPIAAASIAQVHSASLQDGTPVVIKIRRPNIERILNTDLEIMRGLAALMEEHIPETQTFRPTRLIEQLARSLKRECDFTLEDRSMRRFKKLFAEVEHFTIPKVYNHYSTKKLLVQQRIEGKSVSKLVPGELPPERGALLAQVLCKVVLDSIFQHRFFHADPHPGNLLVTPEGTLALVDYGSMGRIDEERMRQILKFMVAALSRRPDQMVQVLRDTQIAPAGLDEITIRGELTEIIDTYLDQSIGELKMTQLIADVYDVVRRHGLHLPTDILLITKTLTLLENVGKLLDPSFVPAAAIKPYLVRCYTQQIFDSSHYIRSASIVLHGYRRLLGELPDELRAMVRSLARGEFTVQERNLDLPAIQRHQNAMLNRCLTAAYGLFFLGAGTITAARALTASTQYNIGIVLMALGGWLLVKTWWAIRRSGGV